MTRTDCGLNNSPEPEFTAGHDTTLTDATFVLPGRRVTVMCNRGPLADAQGMPTRFGPAYLALGWIIAPVGRDVANRHPLGHGMALERDDDVSSPV